ncbi:unnamed protein product [Porites lobata]|uniref:Uncharacterized protein n=1 Tax=Porites lobata TaxID=104759 RepID=A0ABN8S3D3_9CNID|nr:unnamed protein product [Porites lobata]
MHFTSDNDTLVCGCLLASCEDYRCPFDGLELEERKPTVTIINPLNNVSLSDPHFEPVDARNFVLWPSAPPSALTECTFMEQDEGPSWVSKVQREIPYLFSGSYISLNDETILVGSPDHKYVTMLNVGLLQKESDSTYSSNVNMGVREIIFSMEGDAIYVVSSGRFVYISSEVVEITIWKLSSREFLKTKTFFGPVSIVPTKEGLVLFKNDRVAELWNFDLSECIRSIVKLTSDTSIVYSVTLIPVSDELIAFYYSPQSRESIYIRSLEESEENENLHDDLLECTPLEDCTDYCLDVMSTTGVQGRKLVSSLRLTRYDECGYLYSISCNSPSNVLVCRFAGQSWGPIDEGVVTVSLLNKGSIKWERIADNSYLRDEHMIFSPKNEFVVTWNTLDEGQGLHVLDADTGETLHVLLRDQNDIIECKFLNDETLVCCSGDNFLRLCNVRTGHLLSVLDIGEQPLCLGACLNQPLVAIGLSGTRIKFVHVQLPTESEKKY